jgi:hypothetical protein
MNIHSKKSRDDSTRMRDDSTRMRVDSTRLRVDRIDTHLRHTNPTTLRVESTRDFLLCNTHRIVCDVHMHTVMTTRTSVISERKLLFQHVCFIYAECNFHTQSVILTRTM